MEKAIDETHRRRVLQENYNRERGITPRTIVRPVENPLAALVQGDYSDVPLDRDPRRPEDVPEDIERAEVPKLVVRMRRQMKAHAAALEFEEAAELRDRIKALEQWSMDLPV